MTTTTERRAVAVGQVYHFAGMTQTIVAQVSKDEFQYGCGDGSTGRTDAESILGFWGTPDVPAAAPLAADRCRAPEWCGIHRTKKEPGRDIHFFRHVGDYEATETHIYCSEACRDAKYPPLAAHPVETLEGKLCKRCRSNPCNCYTDKAQPAPQPAAAKPVTCIRAGKPGHMKCEGPILSRVLGHKDDGAVAALYCELAMRQWEIRAFHNTKSATTPYTGPERLERPKLAHSAMWADEAEDVR